MRWVLGHQCGLQEPSVLRTSEQVRIYELFLTNSMCAAGKGKSSCFLVSSNFLICSSNIASFMKPQIQFVKHFSYLIRKTIWMLREIAKDDSDPFIFTWRHQCCTSYQYPRFPGSAKTNKNMHKFSHTITNMQIYLSS